MHRYAHYTPMTDTVELAACHRGALMTEVPTAQMWLMDLKPAVAPAVPARPRRRLRAAARTAYTTLITVGVMTLTGCATVGPDGLADALAQVLR
jgi:hypothetical protein